jgi:alkanesulfonate monooxygenase SsuD/methylene tetrahydromethanopterin reductase-like flavin-dependent oxidoreductase (luciferase family)
MLDLGVMSNAPMSRILEIASALERRNVNGIWISEDIDQGSDIFVQASIMMLTARTKNVGICVTNLIARNISTIARAAAALREIDPARFRLSLGVGGLQNVPNPELTVEKPVAMLRDIVDALRRIWAGETLTIEGETIDLQQFLARYKTGFSIPLYLSMRDPSLLRPAARIADGVILSGPIPYLEKTVAILRTASQDRWSRPKLVFWLPTIVIQGRGDRRLAKTAAAAAIVGTPPSVLEMAEISEDNVMRVRMVAQARGYEAASGHVTDELLNSFTVSGDARYICQAFQSLAKLGADEIVFGPPYGNSLSRSIREIAKAWDRH